MNPYFAEFLGTAILLFMGNGVVANVVLSETKGHGSGWIVISAGWGFAVYSAVLCVEQFSGAHINPAVTIGLAAAGEFPWVQVPSYIVAQVIGAFVGTCLVFVFYYSHYVRTDDQSLKLATFSTAPSVRNAPLNLFCEITATFILVYAVLLTADPTLEIPAIAGTQSVKVGLGSIGAIRVGLMVFAIILSLGGTTGAAINPARDLGPRIAHTLLPVPDKGSSDWSYAWIPVFGPILGGLLAAGLFVWQIS